VRREPYVRVDRIRPRSPGGARFRKWARPATPPFASEILMLRDLYNNLQVIGCKVAAPADNTAVVGPIIDTQDFHSVAYLIATGTLADADATFAALLEESDASDMTGATEVADDDMLGTEAGASFTFAADDAVRKIGYKGGERYARLTVTPSGNASAAPITIVAVGIPRSLPAA
jgi:hypothetical protein